MSKPVSGTAQVVSAIAPALEKAGFSRQRGRTWTKVCDEAVLIVSAEADRGDLSAYVDLGTYFLAAGPRSSLDIRDAHVTSRIEQVVEMPDRRRVLQLLKFDQGLSPEARDEELGKLMESRILPWMQEVLSSPKNFVIAGERAGGRHKLGMVLRIASPILDQAAAQLGMTQPPP